MQFFYFLLFLFSVNHGQNSLWYWLQDATLKAYIWKLGKSCSGPEHFPDVSIVEDTTFPSQSILVEDELRESMEATLASLLGEKRSLTTGLKVVQADNQQLHALITNQSPIKEVPVPSTCTGGATASGVTMPELHVMQALS